MNTIIIISVLPIVLLYLGLYKLQKALLPVAVTGLVVALGLAIQQWNNYNVAPEYHGMLLFNNFSVAFSSIAIIITILVLLLSKGYFEQISNHIAEYYSIILFSLAGIIVMVSYYNLTMLFIGIEIMSVSLYILAGIKKNDFASNEAALKYFLMGAFSTGFLLFGVALVYGATGSFGLDGIQNWMSSNPLGIGPLLLTGVILIIIGLCFKAGVAPFHFWTPDVYDGSPTLITAFMSTAVKAASFAALFRLISTCFPLAYTLWSPMLVILAILTLIIGNVTALYQQSFKRMLAYSSVSHAGYLLFAIIALGEKSANTIFIYTAAYSLATIIAFGALILVQQQTGSDNFESFNGLAKKNPFLALVLTIAMLSLAGIPLTAGFIGKFFAFSAALSQHYIWLTIIAVINAIISIFYYFRVIIAMYFRDEERAEVTVPAYYIFVFSIAALATIVIGVCPGLVAGLI